MGKGYEPGNEKFEDFGRNSYGWKRWETSLSIKEMGNNYSESMWICSF
jgi:hypothetical protein